MNQQQQKLKLKLKQIVYASIRDCNDDVRAILSQLGKSFLKSGSSSSVLDAYLSGYGVEYVIINLLDGNFWNGGNFHSKLSSSFVAKTLHEEQISKVLEFINIFHLYVLETYGKDQLKSCLDQIVLGYCGFQQIRKVELSPTDLNKLSLLIEQPIWVFLLIVSLFSLDFAMIPTREESDESSNQQVQS